MCTNPSEKVKSPSSWIVRSTITLFAISSLLTICPERAVAQNKTIKSIKKVFKRPERPASARRSENRGPVRPKVTARKRGPLEEPKPGAVRQAHPTSAPEENNIREPSPSWANVEKWTADKQWKDWRAQQVQEAVNNLNERAMRDSYSSDLSQSRSRSNSLQYDRIPAELANNRRSTGNEYDALPRELAGMRTPPRSMPEPGGKPRLLTSSSENPAAEYAQAPPRRDHYVPMPGLPDLTFTKAGERYQEIPAELKINPNQN